MDLLPWMKQWNMLPSPGGTVLCAVSGGRDSVCLLHYLTHLGRQEGFSVAAAHLHHGQRSTAERDVAFVQQLCRSLDVACYVERADVPGTAAQEKISIEEAGRLQRYGFFERTADAIGAEKIATAHHADDQAETVLLQLLRGSGPDGLGGIPPVRGRVIRPLLQTKRSEIEAYLARHGLSHVEDETNGDLTMARNLLRLELLPQLEAINPALRENICRTAEIVREENAYLDSLAQTYLPPQGTTLSGAALHSAPQALQPRILRLLAARLPVGKKDFGAVHYRQLLQLTASARDGMADLPGGAVALWKDGALQLTLRSTAPAEALTLSQVPAVWGDYTVCWRQADAERATQEGLLLRCDALTQTVTVGPCVPSDRLQLPGSRGRRSIKRLCVDLGIAPQIRDRLPAIYVDGRLAAVYRIGTDQAYLPHDDHKTIEILIETKEHAGGQHHD